MAYNAIRIATAISELLEGTIGSGRVMTAGVMLRGIHRSQRRTAKQARALAQDDGVVRFDVELGTARAHESTAISMGSTRLIDLEIVIPVWMHMRADVEVPTDILIVDLSTRQLLKQILAQHMDDAVLALSWPGNLRVDATSAATGIVSGLMLGPGNAPQPERSEVTENVTDRLYEAEISGRVTLAA